MTAKVYHGLLCLQEINAQGACYNKFRQNGYPQIQGYNMHTYVPLKMYPQH